MVSYCLKLHTEPLICGISNIQKTCWNTNKARDAGKSIRNKAQINLHLHTQSLIYLLQNPDSVAVSCTLPYISMISARLQYLKCVNNGDIAGVHWAIDIIHKYLPMRHLLWNIAYQWDSNQWTNITNIPKIWSLLVGIMLKWLHCLSHWSKRGKTLWYGVNVNSMDADKQLYQYNMVVWNYLSCPCPAWTMSVKSKRGPQSNKWQIKIRTKESLHVLVLKYTNYIHFIKWIWRLYHMMD